MAKTQTIDVGPICPVFFGEWDSETDYQHFAVVTHNGDCWLKITKASQPGDEPIGTTDTPNLNKSGQWARIAFQGEKGDTGEKGEKGDTGAQGPTGAQGIAGEDGEDGAQGIQGPIAAHEWDGTKLRWQNPDGTWGDWADLQGAQGVQGIQGVQGEQGIQGVQGEQGAQGIQGIQGEPGTTGAQGEKGEKGQTGETGPAARISIGTVEGGTEAAVTVSGTAPYYTLDFVLPKGDKGDTGETGAAGEKGANGADGTDGCAIAATGSLSRNTSNATATITATVISGSFTLEAGVIVTVYLPSQYIATDAFSVDTSYTVYLNVNSTGAIEATLPNKYPGSYSSYSCYFPNPCSFMYYNDMWIPIGAYCVGTGSSGEGSGGEGS